MAFQTRAVCKKVLAKAGSVGYIAVKGEADYLAQALNETDRDGFTYQAFLTKGERFLVQAFDAQGQFAGVL